MKRLWLVIGLLSLVILSSCTGFRRSPNDATEYVHRGTEGLVMRFVQNQPPNTIYAGANTYFGVNIELRNKGTYTLLPQETHFELSGYDPSILTGHDLLEFRLMDPLDGKDQFTPDGTFMIIEDEAAWPVTIPDTIDKYPVDLLFTTCYRYETDVTAMVCIDPEPSLASTIDKPCRIHDINMGGGQGAPVAVTRIEEQGSSDFVVFKIHIQNSGSGEVFGWYEFLSKTGFGGTSKCRALEQSDMNIVRITEMWLGDQPLCSGSGGDSCSAVCRPADKIFLYGGGSYAVCSIPAPWLGSGATNAYVTPLRIKLEYGYTDSIMKRVNIIELK